MKKIVVAIIGALMLDNVAQGQTDSVALADTNVNYQTTEVVSTKTTIANGPVYKMKWAVDLPVTLAGIAWSAYAFPKIYSKENSTQAEILALNKNDINGFDRGGADKYSEKAADVSDMLFYGSMPLPFLLFLDKDIRKDFGKISFLYLETMSVMGIFYTGSAYVVDRYRPLAYNSSVPMHIRMDGNSKNSFLGGHPALVATSTFFMAKVFSDYHPESKFKYVLYGTAAAATGITAYLRHRGGRHFPTDLLTGITVGTLNGILVPHFHKNKQFKDEGLSIMPFTGQSHGLAMRYKF